MDLIRKSSVPQTKMEIRNEIEAYEAAMKAFVGSETGDVDEINKNGLSEYICGGAYIRVLDIPKDTTIVSKLWKKDRLWIIMTGEVKIKSEDGFMHIKAPYVGKAPFGSKIALYTLEDTKWAAITGTESVELGDVEEELIATSYDAFLEIGTGE